MTTKIAIIGAGSIVFCKTLILDTLAIPASGARSSRSWRPRPSGRRRSSAS
jgi:hypothetical protein